MLRGLWLLWLLRSHCADHTCSEEKCFQGDVQATLDYGFGSIKLDGCGVQKNITLYSELFNRSGTPVMLENCHNGNPTYPTGTGEGKVDCPMNFFRSSTDIRPTFGSILINLESTAAYNGKGLTGPGCFAYPDMLEVGVTNSQRPGLATLSFTEARTHFGAWCIVSAPLVLGMDLRDEAKLAEVLPIISNTEAMAVNDAWAGDAGVLAKASAETVTLPNCSWFNKDSCKHPAWMVWKKRLPKGKVAVLLMNNANTPATVVGFVPSKAIPPLEHTCMLHSLPRFSPAPPMLFGRHLIHVTPPSPECAVEGRRRNVWCKRMPGT